MKFQHLAASVTAIVRSLRTHMVCIQLESLRITDPGDCGHLDYLDSKQSIGHCLTNCYVTVASSNVSKLVT